MHNTKINFSRKLQKKITPYNCIKRWDFIESSMWNELGAKLFLGPRLFQLRTYE